MKKICFILSLLMAITANVQAQDDEVRTKNGDKISSTPLDTTAEFPGGIEALQQFLQKETTYPPKARKRSIQGRVIVEFIVDKTGNVTNVEVIQSVHPLLDAEAVRVCEAMPQWKPAYKNGQPVKCYYTLPFSFALSDKKAKKQKRKK